MVSLVFKTEQVAIQHLEGILRYKPDCYYQKFYLKFTSGFPDLMVGYKGEIAFYEVKILKTTLKAAIKCFEPMDWIWPFISSISSDGKQSSQYAVIQVIQRNNNPPAELVFLPHITQWWCVQTNWCKLPPLANSFTSKIVPFKQPTWHEFGQCAHFNNTEFFSLCFTLR